MKSLIIFLLGAALALDFDNDLPAYISIEGDNLKNELDIARLRRSPDNQPWQVQPGVGRDENGNVNTGVEVKNKGKDHDFEAGWSKVVRGPSKAKPTWHVGGTWRFKRSPDNQPWEVQPGVGRDENGNVNAGVEVKNKGKDHDFEAGWSKVVRGPSKAKPTWHVGGTWRFKRSIVY